MSFAFKNTSPFTSFLIAFKSGLLRRRQVRQLHSVCYADSGHDAILASFHFIGTELFTALDYGANEFVASNGP